MSHRRKSHQTKQHGVAMIGTMLHEQNAQSQTCMSPSFPLQVRHKLPILHSGPQKTAVPKNPENSGSTPSACLDKPMLAQGGGGVVRRRDTPPPRIVPTLGVQLKGFHSFQVSLCDEARLAVDPGLPPPPPPRGIWMTPFGPFSKLFVSPHAALPVASTCQAGGPASTCCSCSGLESPSGTAGGANGSAQRFVSARRCANPPGCTSQLGPAVAVTPNADGVHLGGRALYPGGLLLIVLMGI